MPGQKSAPTLKITIVPVTPLQQNCTLITDVDSNQTAIVDPGGDADRIMAALTAGALTPTAIWLTHGHLDHAGAATELAGKLHLQIIGPDERDEMLLQNLEAQAAAYGLTGMRNCKPDRYLTEGETLTVGAQSFDVLHCPGHTPGHVVFINRAARFAQVGDVLFQGSVGRTDFPYGDHTALIAAIKEKLLPLGDDIAFVCGHGPSSTFGAERVRNPFIQ